MSSKTKTGGRSYRERDVDKTLDDHESRITRLEMLGLVGVGYGLAEGGTIITEVVQIFV